MSHADAIAATEHVVNAVAEAISENIPYDPDDHDCRVAAVAAIVAYERAMKEIAK